MDTRYKDILQTKRNTPWTPLTSLLLGTTLARRNQMSDTELLVYHYMNLPIQTASSFIVNTFSCHVFLPYETTISMLAAFVPQLPALHQSQASKSEGW